VLPASRPKVINKMTIQDWAFYMTFVALCATFCTCISNREDQEDRE
jgi:hypothetical protein